MKSKQETLRRLKDPRLTDHERESLHQYLHYLDAEGISTTSSNNNNNNNTHYAKNTKKKARPPASTSSK